MLGSGTETSVLHEVIGVPAETDVTVAEDAANLEILSNRGSSFASCGGLQSTFNSIRNRVKDITS